MMKRREFLKRVCVAAVGLGCAGRCDVVKAISSNTSNAPRPNILIIFTDDQGYADLGCYGSKTNKTPQLDKLASEGTRFTSFYAQSLCGPSRSALLTGRYPVRSRGWDMPASEITWAERIKTAGYQTACIGKWDVSNRKAIIERMPNAKGFDYYFGTLGANDRGRVAFYENNEPAGNTQEMGSLTRLYTEKAIDFLKNKRDKNRPFVLYLAHTMMHVIIDASPRFKGRSNGSLYGDVVEEFDYETGRLLKVVDELGLRENTLVIYLTDNGPWNQPAFCKSSRENRGHPEGTIFWGDSGPLRNGKGSCYEGGNRVPCIMRWPGKIPAGKVSDAIFATIDFMPTFARLAGFEAPDDRVIDGVDQTDLMFAKLEKGARDTFLYESSQSVKYENSESSKKKDPAEMAHDNYFYADNGVRQGKWKYLKAEHQVHWTAQDNERKKVEELYDLESDIGERNNLAAEYPEKVRELKELMELLAKGKHCVRGSATTTGSE